MEPAVAAPPGWYPDPTGALRYWDGHTWSNHTLPPLSDEQRAEILDTAVAEAVGHGGKLETQTRHQAVVVFEGSRINHAAHILGVFLTCGLWLIGWLIVVFTEKPDRRVLLRVDPYGRVVRS